MSIEYLLSGHAKKRFKERLNIKNPRRAQRDMEKAYAQGRLLNRMHTDGTCYILFNNVIYIFNETITSVCKLVSLITVYKNTDEKLKAFWA